MQAAYYDPDLAAAVPLYRNAVATDTPHDIVDKYIAYSVLGGFIPIPFVDVGTIAIINYYMIKAISQYYKAPFDSTKTKAVIAAVIAGVLPQSLAAGLPGQIFRLVPIVGPVLNFILEPGFAALVTYVVAEIAISGYATGGDIATVNKAYIRSALERAKAVGVQNQANYDSDYYEEVA